MRQRQDEAQQCFISFSCSAYCSHTWHCIACVSGLLRSKLKGESKYISCSCAFVLHACTELHSLSMCDTAYTTHNAQNVLLVIYCEKLHCNTWNVRVCNSFYVPSLVTINYISVCVAIKHINDSFSCGWIFSIIFSSVACQVFKPLSWIMGCLNWNCHLSSWETAVQQLLNCTVPVYCDLPRLYCALELCF